MDDKTDSAALPGTSLVYSSVTCYSDLRGSCRRSTRGLLFRREVGHIPHIIPFDVSQELLHITIRDLGRNASIICSMGD